MPPDLNDSNYRHWDQDELSEALAACADRWVPELFPAGKINHTTHELRVADISGRPPRNKGCSSRVTTPVHIMISVSARAAVR